jgi:hypothetical protein
MVFLDQGCGAAPLRLNPRYQDHHSGRKAVVDPYLVDWYYEYLDLMAAQQLPADASHLRSIACVDKIENEHIGLTIVYPEDIYIIMICTLDPVHDRALIYHELTHALFLLEHSKYEHEIMYFQLPQNRYLLDWTTRVNNLLTFIRNGGVE